MPQTVAQFSKQNLTTQLEAHPDKPFLIHQVDFCFKSCKAGLMTPKCGFAFPLIIYLVSQEMAVWFGCWRQKSCSLAPASWLKVCHIRLVRSPLKTHSGRCGMCCVHPWACKHRQRSMCLCFMRLEEGSSLLQFWDAILTRGFGILSRPLELCYWKLPSFLGSHLGHV